jgi:hypothetical protein
MKPWKELKQILGSTNNSIGDTEIHQEKMLEKGEKKPNRRIGKTIMGTIWTFKVKDEADRTFRHKSKTCSKEYQQIPGAGFTELFSPVTIDSTVRIMLCLYLFYKEFCTDTLNIEVAFL